MLIVAIVILESLQVFFIWGAINVIAQRETYIIVGVIYAAMQLTYVCYFGIRVMYSLSFNRDGVTKRMFGGSKRFFPWALSRVEIRKRRYEGKSLYVIIIGQNIPNEYQFMKKGVKTKNFINDFALIVYRREILDDILQYIPSERVIGLELVEGKDEKGKYLFREKR